MFLADTVRNAKVDAAVDLIDEGTAATEGKLQLWSGARPVSPGTSPAGSLLAEFDLSQPAFGSASEGEAEAAGMPKETTGLAAAGEGTVIGFARVVDRDGGGLWDDDNVGVGSEFSVRVSSVEVAEDQEVTLVSWAYIQPAE